MPYSIPNRFGRNDLVFVPSERKIVYFDFYSARGRPDGGRVEPEARRQHAGDHGQVRRHEAAAQRRVRSTRRPEGATEYIHCFVLI
jgi:hypothetical protein